MSTAQGQRRVELQSTRSLLDRIPLGELFELPGRPHVVYQLRSYASSSENAAEATLHARNDVPFLFKAFETGQIGPKRMAKMHGGKARIATIHEYLDWTVTAQSAEADDELDFGGFRMLVVLPRYVPQWPPADYLGCQEGVKAKAPALGAPKNPLPLLQIHSKPVCAATIRSGPGYLEVPFVATHEGKRGRGYCRCMVEAIEAISRALGLRKLMLCSTDDALVKSTWLHLGFKFTTDDQMEEWGIPHSDLVYLQNTVQMHKDLPRETPKRWKPVIIKHGDFRTRLYARIGEGRPALPCLHPPSKRQARGMLLPSYSNASSHMLGGFGPAISETSGGGAGLFGDLSLPAFSGKCDSLMTGGSSLPAAFDNEPSSSFQYPEKRYAERQYAEKQYAPWKGHEQEVDGRPRAQLPEGGRQSEPMEL